LGLGTKKPWPGSGFPNSTTYDIDADGTREIVALEQNCVPSCADGTNPDLALATAMWSNRIVGDAELVAERLAALAERTQADEVMVSTMTHGLAVRLETLEIVAEIWDRCGASELPNSQ
jgi:hypothetical protein